MWHEIKRSCLVIVTITSAAIYPVSGDDGNCRCARFAIILICNNGYAQFSLRNINRIKSVVPQPRRTRRELIASFGPSCCQGRLSTTSGRLLLRQRLARSKPLVSALPIVLWYNTHADRLIEFGDNCGDCPRGPGRRRQQAKIGAQTWIGGSSGGETTVRGTFA